MLFAHGCRHWQRACHKTAEWDAARAGNAVVACDPEEYELACGLFGKNHKLVCIPNVVNLKKMHALRQSMPLASPAPELEHTQVGTCGRMEARIYADAPLLLCLNPCEPVLPNRLFSEWAGWSGKKAFHLLLEAHALLLRRGMRQHLCILGEGSERARLEGDIRRLGIEKTAFLPGFTDPCPAMARANALAVSSFFEGLPLSIVEALCLGLPVVAADCPSGPGEVLAHGACGALTPVGDAVALADVLQKVLAQKPDPAVLEAGKSRAEAFTPEATVGAWEDLLAEMGKVCGKK